MLGLVNYGDSSDDDISDEEEVIIEKDEGLSKNSTLFKLPEPKKVNKQTINEIEEDNDEFLNKKEKPELLPPISVSKVKGKVKISIPRMKDLNKDDDEDESDRSRTKSLVSYPKAPGLLGMLPKPNHSLAKDKPIQAVDKRPLSAASSTVTSNNSDEVKKNVGFIPYALMNHKKVVDKMKSKKKNDSSSDEDDDDNEPFFTFNTNNDHLPKVSDQEIQAMITKAANKIEERSKASSENHLEMQNEEQNAHYIQPQSTNNFDQEAMTALLGATKAKRSKLDNIQIIDISANDVVDKDEWIRKTLAGETSYVATGKIDEKVIALIQNIF
jgi:hypothetical protein